MVRTAKAGWTWTTWLLMAAVPIAGGVAASAGEPGDLSPLLRVAEHVVFDGSKGWRNGEVTYRLACGAVVAEAPNGDLLCVWLSGSDNEPATDNCVLLARSDDRGHTWGEPQVLVPAGDMAGAVTILQPTADGRLIALGAHWPADKQYTEWHWFRMESRDSGSTWSAPVSLTLHGDHAAVCQGPVRLANGEYLLPGQFFDQRTQPLLAPPHRLAHAQTEDEALAMPAEGTASAGKFGTHLHGCCVFTSRRDDLAGLAEYGRVDDRPLGLLEPTCVQLRDGTLVMLMRAEWGGYLWRAESTDNGRTWTSAWQTDIPNPTSLAHVLRLPDGRIALVHNAVGGEVGARARRDPLSIWISDDEMESWSIKQDILTGGSLAYPNAIILDGKLAFVYDRDRRQVRFVEVEIPPVEADPAQP
jgi:predicted neuraminidase